MKRFGQSKRELKGLIGKRRKKKKERKKERKKEEERRKEGISTRQGFGELIALL